MYFKLSRLCFALRMDIFNYRNIQLLSFFDRGRCQFFINVYSNNLHTAVNFLSNKALNIPNLLYIEGDLNVRDTEWNSFVSLYPTAGQVLRDLTITTQRPQSQSIRRTLYWVNTRELDRELCTGLSTLYTKSPWPLLTTSSLS